MPLTRRGKLLAGVAALFALSVAGPGCRTSQVCKTCCASPCGNQAGSCETGGCQEGTPTARIAFPIRSRSMTAEPTVVREMVSTPTAVMLRPVPMGSSGTQNGASSTWTPVQRVSGEIPALPESDLSPVASLGRPMPSEMASTTQAPPGEPLLPVPAPPALSTTVGDAGDAKEKTKDNMLPKPKEVPGSGRKTASTGYPDLAPATITHPIDAPREFQMRALSTYIVEPPDFLLVELFLPELNRVQQPTIRSEQLVRPDGTIGFQAFPPIFVAGLTLEQIKRQLAATIIRDIDSLRGPETFKKDKNAITEDDVLKGLKVDVLRYNSKFYYVITDGGGYGEQVIRVALTGNERVLDAVATIQGLPAVSSKKSIWIARATPHDHSHPQILPVDWTGIVQRGSAATNYQLFPGDRLYVNSDPKIRFDSRLAKLLAPVERLLGVTLLGSGVVNSIKSGGTGGNTAR